VSTIDGGVATTGTTDRMINSFAMTGRASMPGSRANTTGAGARHRV
jgi:hypothetical protein